MAARSPTFVGVEQIKESLDRPPLEPEFPDPLLKPHTGLIPPAETGHETIPDQALLVATRPALLEGPVQNLIVGPSEEGPLDQLAKRHTQEMTASAVQKLRVPISEIGHILRRQLPGGIEPDLVEHPAKVDQAAHFGVR